MNLEQRYLNECKNDFKRFKRLLIVWIVICIIILFIIASCRPKIDFKDNIVISCDSTIAMNDSIITIIKDGNIYIIKGNDTLVKSE